MKRCLFCGSEFTGQKKNFEHVISDWLVREADLKKRLTDVNLSGKNLKVPMSKFGAKTCVACNNDAANMEGLAKQAYEKIRDGIALSQIDANSILDWIDKLRVGLWLWLAQADREKLKINPKFYINQRMAAKDRILLISRYPETSDMRGMAIWGASMNFVFMPSTIGFLINNICFVSISSDFVVARHIRNTSYKRFFDNSEREKIEIKLENIQKSKTIKLIGSQYIIGQCIMPDDCFTELEITIDSSHKYINSWSKSAVMRLNSSLKEISPLPAAVDQFNGNVTANIELAKIDMHSATAYLLQDCLDADFSAISPAVRQDEICTEIRSAVALENFMLSTAEKSYWSQSGIMLNRNTLTKLF